MTGETVLVRGGASAVGTAAIQLAVAAGARVIAVAGGPEKAALCTELGAARAVDHTAEDVFDVVMDETGDRGADVIFDPIGGDQTEMLWTCGALGGRYLAVGFNDDPESGLTGRALRKLSMANMTVMGVLLAYLDTPRDFRRFGINGFPPEVGQRVHDAPARAGRGRPDPAGRGPDDLASTRSGPPSRTTPPGVRRAARSWSSGAGERRRDRRRPRSSRPGSTTSART